MSRILNIGVIIADKNEYEPAVNIFNDYFVKDKPLFSKEGKLFEICKDDNIIKLHILLSGVGKVNTAVSTANLLKENDMILNFGYCGGIAGQKRGDIVLATSFIEHDFDITIFGYEPAEKPGQDYIYTPDKKLCKIFKKVCSQAKEGRVASGDSFVCEESTADFLKRNLMSVACDMEAAAAAYACNLAKKPFLSFKEVSDNATEEAPEDYREINDSFKMSMAEIFKDFIFELFKYEEYFI